ncbi:zf-DHHC-domain-containing protein [Pleomassaria siparia CBS 279.74]|uniref:Palmitoyltransferase PFA4 n=1 Tax=Pleomassaria siparia CBS 279.74 TaxID=1314801 RepID=A0A6G1K3Z4_9PLEO|nr:zf-DHHC-domain-containing protein [Pleomassaria siparia CBS 279.74]
MSLEHLAVPSVYALITFLAYTSQVLFLSLEPYPLERKQLIRFNALLVCLLISYTRCVFVDPGGIPKKRNEEREETEKEDIRKVRKWCRKCDAPKTPRSHHCKACKRCIPKMDHHCPWTQNCVSHTTFPHFLRFLFYAVVSMLYLSKFLWIRASHLWANRDLPSYLGPNIFQMAHLFMLCVTNFFTLFVLSMLFVRVIWCLAVNTTTIEGWEIERHRTLVRRARHFGGFLEGPDGVMMRIQKQEFPYDIGIWNNFVQGMGTWNILSWFNPLAATPSLASTLNYETNGFESPTLSWPPPDPDRLTRKMPKGMDRPEEAFTYRDAELNPSETLAAFRKRQDDDVVRRRKPFVQRVEAKLAQKRTTTISEEDGFGSEAEDDEICEGTTNNRDGDSVEGNESGEEGWRNSEGERLKDFGVDEDVEFYDEREDDLPLGQLLALRRERAAAAAAAEGTL